MKNSQDYVSHQDYSYWLKAATWASVSVALLLIVIKTYAWLVTDSASMLASLSDSFIDALASLMTFIAVRYAVQPADNEHRFGHGKAESLAALMQATLICGSAIVVVVHSVHAWVRGEAVSHVDMGIIVSAIAIGLTLCLVGFQLFVIKKTQSQAIAADALHFKSDILLNVAVIFALVASGFDLLWADKVFAIAIALYLLFSASQIALQAFHSLVDRELSDDVRKLIVENVLSIEGVLGVHDLRTRESGSARFIQLHIEVADDLSLLAAHDIANAVELCLKHQLAGAEVIVHVDPLSVVAQEAKESPFFDGDSSVNQ